MDQSHIKLKVKCLEFKEGGQSLVEILIAVAVSAILIGGAVTLITITLRSNAQNKFLQSAAFLSQDLMDKVSSFAGYSWNCNVSSPCGIYNLNKGISNRYYLATTTSPFQPVVGSELVAVDAVVYTRSFYIDNVSRDSAGTILTTFDPLLEDPSTQKITTITSWQQSGQTSDIRFSKYITRNRNEVIVQTDWSGGSTTPQDIPIATSSPKNQFYDSTNINITTIGSIKLQ